MSRTIQHTLTMLCNHISWFGLLCHTLSKPLVRHGNRALTGNSSFLPVFVFCLLFFVIPDSVCLAKSPYINKVYEYHPAPGQFVNVLPEYEKGDDANMMRLKAEESIADNNQVMITLGGWGGYVVFGFDHMIQNIKGEYDFIVLGNAFYASSNPNPDAGKGGSCEPGVVQVSYDANGNGKPDDEWFEIAGSEYGNKSTYLDYQLTYYRPAADHVPTPDKEHKDLIDTTYIAWKDNKGHKGYMNQLSYHTQPYFPQWLSEDELTFSGIRLPDNYKDESGEGTYYVLYAYPFGYADNHPNNTEEAKLKIDWAVNAKGQPANLPGIHFVKVYTGVHQQCGWLGETSTEVLGATDLHPDAPEQGFDPIVNCKSSIRKVLIGSHLYILHGTEVYSFIGTKIE